MSAALRFIYTVWTLLKKDLRVWLRQPTTIASTLVPVIGFLLVNALGTAAVGRSPVALVNLDHDGKGQQIQQIFHNADVFRITDSTPSQAQTLYHTVQVVAIITIPTDFTQRVEAHERAPIQVEVNNLNLDFTNDIRRAVPDVITQYYQTQGQSSPVQVTFHETDLRSQDIELFAYSVLPSIVLLLTISGLVNGAIATAREWESQTVKELLLSPTARSALVAGKVLAGFIITFVLGTVVLFVGYLLGWTKPVGVYWLTALLSVALISLMSAGLGVAVGSGVQRIQAVSGISINISFYLFFLAGGVGVLAFEPDILQNIAAFDPLAYGRHALEMAVFYNSTDLLGRDITVLLISTLVALVLGSLSMRRGIAY
jgi:ABC-type multidrug transport system permease subunit